MNAAFNKRLVNTARSMMGAYARKWKAIRRDEIELDRANGLLRSAIEWRNKSRLWTQNPL